MHDSQPASLLRACRCVVYIRTPNATVSNSRCTHFFFDTITCAVCEQRMVLVGQSVEAYCITHQLLAKCRLFCRVMNCTRTRNGGLCFCEHVPKHGMKRGLKSRERRVHGNGPRPSVAALAMGLRGSSLPQFSLKSPPQIFV